jgi:hypothetical protein
MRLIVACLFISLAVAGQVRAQRGIPAPRPIPPAPAPRPIVPVVPRTSGHGGSGSTASDSGIDPTAILLVIVAGVGGIAGLMFAANVWNGRTVARLRITGTPPGEAPEEIRKAWVGVELPLRRGETEPERHHSFGVLTEQGPEAALGYSVDGRAAVKALASQVPEAAAWWREHAPHVVARGYRLFFPLDVCERVE